MQYIIIDLEWNQPLSYQSRVYREVGDQLNFEMIQIGAARMDPDLKVAETASFLIRPTMYQRIHPRIRRMTGLGQEELADAPQFNEAMAAFEKWCGEDYVLLTWGIDDISVLQQNIDFFGYSWKQPLMCDIQRLFSDVHQLKDRSGLSAAMELVGIAPEEDRPFHNAEHDAYYTGLVFATCPEPDKVLNYPQHARKLTHAVAKKEKGQTFATIAEAFGSEQAMSPVCPVCGKPAKPDGRWVPQSPDKYISLAKCRAHGTLMLRARFRVTDEDRKALTMSVSKAAPSNVAYVHTKQMQVDQREREYEARYGHPIDYDEALLNADRSSVPFEDGGAE